MDPKQLTVTVEYDHYHPRHPITVTYNPDKGRTKEQAEHLAAYVRQALTTYQPPAK